MWSRLSAHQKITAGDLGDQEEDRGDRGHEVVHVAIPKAKLVATPKAEASISSGPRVKLSMSLSVLPPS